MKKMLINFINYELKILNKNCIFENFFENLSINFQFYNKEEKETYLSIFNYYNSFTDNKNFEEMFNTIHKIFNDQNNFTNTDIKIFKKNDKFLLYNFYFYDSNISYLSIFYTCIIYNSFIENGVVLNKFEKSDIILFKAVKSLKNFFIFFEKEKDVISENFEIDLISHVFPLFEYLCLIKIIKCKIIIKKELNILKTEKF
jgi:hypothetical protein